MIDRGFLERLGAVRRRARRGLVARRVAQLVVGLTVAGLLAVALDYTLRPPGPVRLAVLLGVLAAAVAWGWPRLRRAWAYRPSMVNLALRLEQRVPGLRGRLASAVDGVDVPLSASELDAAQPERLLDLSRVKRWLMGAGVSAAVLLLWAVGFPGAAATGVGRFAWPVVSVAWPNRVALVDASSLPAVVASDAAVPLRASVTRGAEPGLRVWVRGEVSGPAGQVEPLEVLLTPQAGGSGAGGGGAASGAGMAYAGSLAAMGDVWNADAGRDPAAGVRLRYRLEAGDGVTRARSVRVVPRPTLTGARARVTPPAYAASDVSASEAELLAVDGSAAGRVTALAGSRLELTLSFNKPLPSAAIPDMIEGLPPGAAWAIGTGVEAAASEASVSFVLEQDLAASVALEDAVGLSSAETVSLRVRAVQDLAPGVSVLEPASDRAVLVTAVVPLVAEATDDLRLTRAWLDAVPEPAGAGEPAASGAGEAGSASDGLAEVSVEGPGPWTVASHAGGGLEAVLEATLVVSTLGVEAGDAVRVRGYASDAVAGRGPSASVVRRLRVVGVTELVEALRARLASVRRTAERGLRLQERVASGASPSPVAEQGRAAAAAAAAQQGLEAVRAEVELNRLNRPELSDLVERGGVSAASASAAAAAAERRLREGAGADREQAEASAALADLVSLLNQGGEALELRLALSELRDRQAEAATQTRRLIPELAGRPSADLTSAEREAIDAVQREQSALGDAASELRRRLEAAAQRLARDAGSDAERVAAEAMRQAAEAAEASGLERSLSDAEAGLSENRLSDAASGQAGALEAMDRMLERLGDTERLKLELLRRRLADLAQRLERLIAAQEGLVAQVEAAVQREPVEVVTTLAGPQLRQWESTLAAEASASEAEGEALAAVADSIGRAASAMAEAVPLLRADEADGARARQAASIVALQEALAGVRAASEAAGADEAGSSGLEAAYLQLAEAQAALRAALRRQAADAGVGPEVEPAADAAEPADRGEAVAVAELLVVPDREARLGRRLRAGLRGLADEQGGRLETLDGLRAQVEGKVAFGRGHDRVEAAMAEAGERLRRAAAAGDLETADRAAAQAERGLRDMAASLKGDPRNNEFAENRQNGGGGGGEGQQDPIPDAAELKLLRAMQIELRDRTLAAHVGPVGGPGPGPDPDPATVRGLAEEQDDLRALAAELIQAAGSGGGPEDGSTPTPMPLPEVEELPGLEELLETDQNPGGGHEEA